MKMYPTKAACAKKAPRVHANNPRMRSPSAHLFPAASVTGSAARYSSYGTALVSTVAHTHKTYDATTKNRKNARAAPDRSWNCDSTSRLNARTSRMSDAHATDPSVTYHKTSASESSRAHWRVVCCDEAHAWRKTLAWSSDAKMHNETSPIHDATDTAQKACARTWGNDDDVIRGFVGYIEFATLIYIL